MRHLPLFLCKDGWTFVSGDFGVVVYSNNQLVAEGFGLSKCICMPEVNHVVAKKTKTKNALNRLELGASFKLCFNLFKAEKFLIKRDK